MGPAPHDRGDRSARRSRRHHSREYRRRYRHLSCFHHRIIGRAVDRPAVGAPRPGPALVVHLGSVAARVGLARRVGRLSRCKDQGGS
ncbi:hypothetical protein [Streptomyces sp900116325]|uniref:hypothetical protein n=1 Tax=Streptomyces sp. 900116325 TaxID=3154295 RepID=UPI0033FF9EE5